MVRYLRTRKDRDTKVQILISIEICVLYFCTVRIIRCSLQVVISRHIHGFRIIAVIESFRGGRDYHSSQPPLTRPPKGKYGFIPTSSVNCTPIHFHDFHALFLPTIRAISKTKSQVPMVARICLPLFFSLVLEIQMTFTFQNKNSFFTP